MAVGGDEVDGQSVGWLIRNMAVEELPCSTISHAVITTNNYGYKGCADQCS